MTNNETTATQTFTVRTGAGTVHSMTAGRTWKSYGETCTVEYGVARGPADCGAKISSAAKLTSEAVTCPNCLAK